MSARIDASAWVERAAAAPGELRDGRVVVDVRTGEGPERSLADANLQVLVGREPAGPAPDAVVIVGAEDFLVRSIIAIGQLVERPGLIRLDLSDFRALFGGKGPVSGCSVAVTREQVGRDYFTGADVEQMALLARATVAPKLATAQAVLLHFEMGESGALYSVNAAVAAVAESAPDAGVAFTVHRTDGQLRLTVLVA